MLARGGTAVGDEIIEVRWGDSPAGQPVLDERPTMIIIDDALALVFGLLPDIAVSAEAVAPDGERVTCTAAPGVWLVVLPNNQLGRRVVSGPLSRPGRIAGQSRPPGRLGARGDRRSRGRVSCVWGQRVGPGDGRLGRHRTLAQYAVGSQLIWPREGLRLPRLRTRRPDRPRVRIWPTLGLTEADHSILDAAASIMEEERSGATCSARS